MLRRYLIRTASQHRRFFSTSIANKADFTHAVIGGGAVGLAISRQLQARGGASTILIEQHGAVGTETSSRNSEVIHAGLYYGLNSLKTELCIRGRIMLYHLCEQQKIPYRNTGKLVVAQNEAEWAVLKKIQEFSQEIEVPTSLISSEEVKIREPAVQAKAGALSSPTTGILDSHSYMQFLHGDFEDHGGVTAFRCTVTRIVPRNNGANGWEVWTKPTSTSGEHGQRQDSTEETCIIADTLINSAGLYAVPLSNSILPKDRHIKPYYAKGSYYSYSASKPRVETLIYPAPKQGHAGLGTHLTLDMGNRIRFGPDVEWVDSPTDYSVSDKHLAAALDDICEYLPGIDRDSVALDYAGIRPKMDKASAVASGKGFKDFYIKKEDGFHGFVNLMGIESPGLTSSLAIAEFVEKLLHGRQTDYEK
jgi:2-hydroxyglutarate dehydrogenase